MVEIIKSVAYQNAGEVSAICQEFFKKMNLNYFDYSRLYNDGSMLLLVSDQHWMKHFFEQNYPAGGMIKKDGIYPWSSHLPKQAVIDAKKYFNHCNGLTVIKKFPDYIEFYDFASPPDNLNISHHYFNNFELFETFQYYFTERANGLIKTADENRLMVPSSEPESIISPKLENEIMNLIKPKYFYLTHNGHDVKITHTEMRCLLLAAEGATAKQTAFELGNVSPRTIETHLTNLRNKFSVGFSTELIPILKSNYKKL